MKKYDIVLYGASSFVGQITAKYLDGFINTQAKNVRFAVAGRNQSKLATLTKQLSKKSTNHNTDIIIADSDDIDSLRAMVQQTKVIISTVGPYDLYGDKLVQVCSEEGVHYCDLAGEAHWIKRMIDKYEDMAGETGACIVSCCGFDSVPSDLGVYLLQQAAIKQYGEPCIKVNMRLDEVSGSFSGGTVASMVNIFKKAKSDTALRKALSNPYLLSANINSLHDNNSVAEQQQKNTRQNTLKKPIYEADYQRWTAPFIMEAINSKVVHRTNTLLDYQYSPEFQYQEGMFTGDGKIGQLKAYAITAGLASLAISASFDKSRNLLEKYVLPKSGSGPTVKQQEEGYYKIMFDGSTASGKQIKLECTGDRDPGYGSTAKILGQAALCLLQDLPAEQAGGFYTPASLLNDKLASSLEQHAGVTFELVLGTS